MLRAMTRGRLAGWLGWFVALNVLWLVLISAWVWEEEVLGLFASAVAATAAEAVREQGLAGFRLRVRWLWHVRVAAGPGRARDAAGAGAPWPGRWSGVVGSTAVSGWSPCRCQTIRDEQAAKRALLTAGESFAPNAYVVAIDNREGLMLMHELLAEGEE